MTKRASQPTDDKRDSNDTETENKNHKFCGVKIGFSCLTMADRANKNIIVTHKLFAGAGQDLYRYFITKGMPVLLVEHSFLATPNRKTSFSYFNGYKETKKTGLDYRFFSDIVCYVKDFFYSLYAAIRYPYRYKVYFGCGGFNVIPGLILRLFKRVSKVVFYTIDFMPVRFNNRILNNLYLTVDRLSVRYADQTWNLSERMAEGRERYNFMPREIFNRQKTVPIGVWLEDSPALRPVDGKKHVLVFSGHLEKHFGVQLVLEAIPEIIKKVPDFKFLIIGDGDFKAELVNLARDLRIDRYVEFHGPVYEQKELSEILTSARVSIAPYEEERNGKVYFADSTKPKVYLSCGLPLIITRVAWIHQEVEKRNMGLTINYDKQQLTDAVIKLMTDNCLYEACRMNAKNFMANLDWNNIFKDALMGLNGV